MLGLFEVFDTLGFHVAIKSWVKGREIPLVVQCYRQSETGTTKLTLLIRYAGFYNGKGVKAQYHISRVIL